MKRDKNNVRNILARCLSRYGEPLEEHVASAVDDVWQRLEPEVGNAMSVVAVKSRPRQSWRVAGGLAAAAIFAFVIFLQMPQEIDASAIVANGALSRVSGEKTQTIRAGERIEAGEILRTNGGSAIALADDSSIEIRSESEFSLERADDGVRIHLRRGGLIVHREDGLGNLYVETRDVTALTAGTAFVNAREAGSRVAVIQGEVHVKQGNTVNRLLPGDQIATGASMETLPMAAEISWSQNAREHLAILQQNITVRTPAPSHQAFAAAVVKPHDPRVPLFDAGFGCRGIDGKRMAPFGESGEPDFVVPKGRCLGTGVLFPQLIAFAFGLPQKYGPGVPDWAVAGTATDVLDTDVTTGQTRTIRRLVRQRFQINAVAEDPSSATADQLRQMLQTLLTERFKLEFHRETLEVPGYALSPGSTPVKLKELAGDETRLVADFSSDPPMLRGRSTIDAFIVFLVGFANPTGYVDGDLPSYILDKTGLRGIYEWEFVLPTPTNIDGVSDTGPVIVEPSAVQKNAWRGPALADAVEKQLGLRMRPQKVPVEVLVIDRVEKPTFD